MKVWIAVGDDGKVYTGKDEFELRLEIMWNNEVGKFVVFQVDNAEVFELKTAYSQTELKRVDG